MINELKDLLINVFTFYFKVRNFINKKLFVHIKILLYFINQFKSE